MIILNQIVNNNILKTIILLPIDSGKKSKITLKKEP
jgi:hypothetical protein